MTTRTIPLRSFLIRDAARAADLPVELVRAVVQVESSGNPYAYNPEPPYRWLWDVREDAPFRRLTALERASESPPDDFHSYPGVPRDAEWQAQQASWGLMQVMGGTARWLGFTEPWLTTLINPEVGLLWGCRYLAKLMDQHGTVDHAVAAYNAGSVRFEGGVLVNQGYVDKINEAMGGV